MTNIDPRMERRLRRAFRLFNRFMVLMWRLGLGAWGNRPELTGRIMVVTHRGRRSGRQRRTPVNYAIVGGELYCLAGFGEVSDWYRNIRANPEVEVWLPEGWWAGTAEEVHGGEARLPILRQILINSGFAGRMAGLNPRRMGDDALEQATAGYPLIHIRRLEPRTGPGGPGDVAWIWPAATFALLYLLSRRRRK